MYVCVRGVRISEGRVISSRKNNERECSCLFLFCFVLLLLLLFCFYLRRHFDLLHHGRLDSHVVLIISLFLGVSVFCYSYRMIVLVVVFSF